MSEKLKITPLHPLFGAEIEGLDLGEPLNDATFAEVLDAFNTYSVLLFREQDISDDQHVEFSRRFGKLEETTFSIAAVFIPAHRQLVPGHSRACLDSFSQGCALGRG